MFRPRVGSRMIRCAGARFGEFVWCDGEGEYQVDADSGVSTYFFHRVELKDDGSLIVRCKDWRRMCPVKAKLAEGGSIIWLKERHNHLAERRGHGRAYYECRASWIRDIRKEPREPPRKSILKARRRLSTDEARTIVAEQHARTARWQAARVRPTSVRDLTALHVRISGDPIPGYTVTEDGERFLSFHLPSSETLILTTRRQLNLIHRAQMLHADATYQTTPRRLCKQIFSIHGNFEGQVEMILCALMKKCDADSYREVFQYLKRETGDDSLPAYMGDFDPAIRRAVAEEFPHARRYGCLFHYSQAVVRKACSRRIGLAKELHKPTDPESKVILKRFVGFTALPLLPAEDIESVFIELKNEALKASPKFRRLVDYIENFWLGTIGVKELSLHDVPNACRTNNAVESWHAKLKKAVGAHPSTWNLVAALNDFCRDSMTNILIRGDGTVHVVSKPNRATKKNCETIRKASQKLVDGTINPLEFINAVKYRVGGAAARHGPADENEELISDVWNSWDSCMGGRESVIDQDYEVKTIIHPFGDHSYARLVGSPPDHNYASHPARGEADTEPSTCGLDDSQQDSSKLGDPGELVDESNPGNVDDVRDGSSNPQTPRITDEMDHTIKEVLSDESDRTLLHISNHKITRKDLNTLDELNWLNDTIMDVYLDLIVRRNTESADLPKVHAFSTFFLHAFEQWEYKGVHKWTKGLDIFANDILLIPIFSTNHWSMVIVDLRFKEIKFLDSLGRRNTRCLHTVLEYLDHEHEAKNGCPLNDDEWHLTNAEELPLQSNGSDCGVFALKYADYGARDAEINFTQHDMPYFRRRMMLEILRSAIYPGGYG